MANNRHYYNKSNRPKIDYQPQGDAAILAKGVAELGLKPETVQILLDGKVLTVRDIAVRSERDMQKVHCFAKRHLFEVKKAIEALGIGFRPEEATEQNKGSVGKTDRSDKQEKAQKKEKTVIPLAEKDEAALARTIEDAGFSEITLALLKEGRIRSLKDLTLRTERELFRIKHFGKANLQEVKKTLAAVGYQLKEYIPQQKREVNGNNGKAVGEPAPRGRERNNGDKHEHNGKVRDNGDKNTKGQNGKERRNDKQRHDGSSKNREKDAQVCVMPEYIEEPPTVAEVASSVHDYFNKAKFIASTPFTFDEDRFKKFSKAGKFGFLDKATNKEVIPPIYDEVSSFKEDMACVEKNGLFGYINRENELVIPYKYDCAMSFSEGLACVTLNERSGYIDKSGAVVLEFIYDAATSFEDGKARVRIDGRWALLEKDGVIRYL